MALSKKKRAEFLSKLSDGEALDFVISELKVSPKDFMELVTSDLHSFVAASVPNLMELVLLYEKERRTLQRIERIRSKIEKFKSPPSEVKEEVKEEPPSEPVPEE